MFKKIILFIFVLFLAVPAAFADDSSIIPVIWLFAKNNSLESEEFNNFFNDNDNIYEMNGYSTPLNSSKVVKSYYFSADGNIYEMNGYSIPLNSSKVVKSYYFSADGNIYEMNGYSIPLNSSKVVKSYYL